MALPIAVLISSVMIMGNMSERYEFASFKSAGVPLLRVMMPLIFFASGVSIFSFLCSNYFIPVANLQFKSRLYDIRKQKPTLNLEQGVFNEDFKGFNIHIGHKEKDNKTISDVLIYNHDNSAKERISIITAKKGEMFVTGDKQFFIMNLYDGTQYQETKEVKKKGNGKDKPNTKNFPFVRTSFKEWTKVFDLSQFDISGTDESLFENHHTMLTTGQLRTAIDSLDSKLDRRLGALNRHMNKHFQLTKKKPKPRKKPVKKKTENKPVNTKKDSTNKKVTNQSSPLKPNKKEKKASTKTTSKTAHKAASNFAKVKPKRVSQIIDKPLTAYDSFIETIPLNERSKIFSKSKSFARSIRDQANAAVKSIASTKEIRVKHIYELNIKFSFAVVCTIFLFIGGPMGAIIRKGGFGYPILIAIFFFMIFMVLNIFCKKLAESFVLPAFFATWVPCLILFPIGLILTYRAMNDSPPINISWITNSIDFIKNLFSKKDPQVEG